MFRIIYGRFFMEEKDALRAARMVSDLSPVVKESGRLFAVELSRYRKRKDADAAYSAFSASGLRVFIQEISV